MREMQAGAPADDDGSVPGDGALLERLARGDEAAFMTVYDRYADALFGTAFRFLHDREAAAEVVQESFLALWRRARQFDAAAGTLAGWLLGIGRNQAIDRLRAEARRPQLLQPTQSGHAALDRAGGENGLDWASARLAAPRADEPPEETDRRWLRALLRTTLSEMRPEEREVLVLAYDQGLSQSDIAARLGVPIGTVKSRTRRALLHLRDRLGSVPGIRPAGALTEARGEPEGVR